MAGKQRSVIVINTFQAKDVAARKAALVKQLAQLIRHQKAVKVGK